MTKMAPGRMSVGLLVAASAVTRSSAGARSQCSSTPAVFTHGLATSSWSDACSKHRATTNVVEPLLNLPDDIGARVPLTNHLPRIWHDIAPWSASDLRSSVTVILLASVAKTCGARLQRCTLTNATLV
jgi:hypothetical protein